MEVEETDEGDRKKLAKNEITNLKILNGHILFELTGDFKIQVA